MKKEIVFVIPSLSAGGAEKSLVNLLNTIDYSLYNVDLILFHQSGLFLTMVPNQVTILNIGADYTTFSKGILGSLLGFLKQLKLQLFINRIIFLVKNNFIKNKAVAEQNSWTNIQKSIRNGAKKYDTAIGFLEKSSIYYIVDKIHATKKIGWIHTNYSKSGMNPAFDTNYFEKLTAIIGVSPECVADLKNHFPKLSNHIKIIYNIVSPALITNLANESINDKLLNTSNLLVTVARLSPEKGCDIALEASKIMRDKGIDFRWIIIGDGQDKTLLKSKIAAYQLQNNFQLIGLKENPYPYIKACAIYVQPSRYEGKSMAIEEAKILKKPIVIANFATANDQINNGENGIIANMNPDHIADQIIKLLSDKELQNQFALNLSNEKLGTETEINKLYNLINE
jgi:glycosyltransferase involved in cell wall biosynthesis